MDFGDALRALRTGQRAARPVWDGGQYVAFQPRAGQIAPHLVIRRSDGLLMPWTPLSWDLLADDWEAIA